MLESLFLGNTEIALCKWHYTNPAAVEHSLYLSFTLDLQCCLWIACAWLAGAKKTKTKVMIMCVG
jgi:hypothetical protein